MTAASANRLTPRYGEHVEPIVMEYPIADNVHIFEGTLVALDAAGYVRPAAASTAVRVLGVSEAEYDNTVAGHVAGALSVRIRQGTFKFANDGGSALANPNIGGACYAMDDSTVSGSDGGSTRVVAGTVEKVEASGVWVKVNADYRGIDDSTLRTDLASVANGDGAALVAIEDAAGLLAAANVEAALAELAKYQPINLADPGTGVAIPVTRSAYIGITTAAAETNTLAIPTFLGQKLILNCDTYAVGNRVVTCAQAINQAGNTVMTFGAARDCIVLEAIKVGGALRWTVTGNDGVALS